MKLFEKINLSLNRKRALLAAMVVSVLSASALAADPTPTPAVDMTAVTDGLSSMYTTASNGAITAVGNILPAIAGIVVLMFLIFVVPRVVRALRRG